MKSRLSFNNPWFLPASLSLLLWALVPWTREITDTLRRWNVLRTVLIAAGVGFFIGAGWTWRDAWQALTNRRRATLLLILLVYAVTIVFVGVMPEERIHFLQVTLLTALYGSAMVREGFPPSRSAMGAALLAGGVGVVEETIQLWVPGRQFDWRDIGMNLVAAGFSWALLYGLLAPRR